MKLKNKKIALIRTFAMTLALVFALTYASFAWIKREWAPKIGQEGISIATSGALVFQFTDNGDEVNTTKSVNDMLGVNDFSLKPVSSSSGKMGEFFALEFGDEAGMETYKHLNYLSEGMTNETSLGIRYGYIVLNFKLKFASVDSDDEIRYVYLNPDSHISPYVSGGDVTSAIRVSIYSEQVGSNPIIIGTEAAQQNTCVGVTNEKDTSGNFVADGERLFDEYSTDGNEIRNEKSDEDIDLLKNQTITLMKDYDCINDSGEFDASEALFEIDSKTTISVTVCIWLEGEDPLCNDNITDGKINLLIQFSARTATENEKEEA